MRSAINLTVKENDWNENFSIEQLNLIFGKVLEIDENVLFSLNGI